MRTPRKILFSRLLLLALVLSPASIPSLAKDAGARERVFFLHGLGRSSASMFLLKLRLEKQGFEVISKDYASTEAGIDDHVEWLAGELESCCRDEGRRLHFVTHSIGGIVLRAYLEKHDLPALGRVVMLAPPNRGSELADFLSGWSVYQMAVGPSGQEIGTDDASVPNLLGPVDFDLGVIAGERSINPFYSSIIPGPDDGKVSVERARVEGMSDFLVVRHSHTFIMNSSEVAGQIETFLRTGAFTRGELELEPEKIEEEKHGDPAQR